MRGKRYSEEQIVSFLREAEVGVAVKTLRRRHGSGEQGFYRSYASGGPCVQRRLTRSVGELARPRHSAWRPDPPR